VATGQGPNLPRLARAAKMPGVAAGSGELSGMQAWYAWSQLDKILNLTVTHQNLLGAYARREVRKLGADWLVGRSMPTPHCCCLPLARKLRSLCDIQTPSRSPKRLRLAQTT
jgi:hypothetical protein